MNKRIPKPIESVRRAKQQIRLIRRQLSLPEKVAQVVELQKAVLPLIRRRRALKPWEKVWKIR